MNNLIDKYRKDELDPEELAELKKKANSMDDSKIEEYIHSSWLDDEIDDSSVSDELMDKIKGNIQATIEKKRRSGFSLLIRRLQTAAAVLLPVFIVLTIYLYKENTSIISNDMVFSTGKAERASITLPDGSVVSLNTDSKLIYTPKEYNRKERKIFFSGEGYFRIFHNHEIPFIINAKESQVTVLGTTFNLLVRDHDNTVELALEEGSVSLFSSLSNKSVILKQNQKAILDLSTGVFTILSDENIKDVSAWKRGDLVFRNANLSHVIRQLEENYNVTLNIDCEDCFKDPFTGTLPVNHLNEALEILEHSYHLKAVLHGNEIQMK